MIRPTHASAARSAVGRSARKTSGSARADTNGTRSTLEAYAQPAPSVDFNPMPLVQSLVGTFGVVREVKNSDSPEVGFYIEPMRAYAAAPLLCHRLSDCGRSLYARSMIGTSRSGSALFITYSSTNHKIRPGISQYAESRMIGRLGNRCLMWQATASASIPSCLYSSTAHIAFKPR